jgi:GMP synthase (glutamine-hydrolysing)
MKKLVILKTGSTFSDTSEKYGDFDEMICRGLGVDYGMIVVVNAFLGDPLPAPSACSGIIISGSHCMVTDNSPWSLAIERWLPSVLEENTPMLGICYGHQLLGRAMGGRVDYHPLGEEVGTVSVRLRPESRLDPLFSKMPQEFHANVSHAQSVLALPPGAVLLAENDFEPHQAFRLGSCAWGVQFHPEFTIDITRDDIMKQADTLAHAGSDICSLLKNLRETPHAHSLLARFAQLAIDDAQA